MASYFVYVDTCFVVDGPPNLSDEEVKERLLKRLAEIKSVDEFDILIDEIEGGDEYEGESPQEPPSGGLELARQGEGGKPPY